MATGTEDVILAPRPKRRVSRTLMILGIVGGVGIVGCCGMGLIFNNVMNPSLVNQPEQVQEELAKVMELNVPEGFTPDSAQSMDNFLFLMRAIFYRQQDGRGWLRIFQFQPRAIGPDIGKKPTPFEAALEQVDSNYPQLEPLNAPEEQIVKRLIGNREVPIRILEGEAMTSRTRYVQITARFPGKVGDIDIKFQIEANLWNDEKTAALIDQIK
ncbi:hypothetical protein Plim_3415 [Planctopirus limnophila DSM 3776]|uniref:Uncharacterized protein n=1 Tax=Planctopirus limnophila (strain ATCC 43296 / DSM 3776 / IFAM 1008 / Mu 290) TaxID=521674 RepID=D5SUH5_PLAL2|nr:hypothetical protein [Planctopirus limnophila]ADG69228.1 hypothetical protein Plim_3415 [Planctopirus limnophila DSM 3776]